MTAFTLRKGNASTTRTDLVVVGVGLDEKGTPTPAPGAEPIAEAMGRGFLPTLASADFHAKPGETLRVPHVADVRAGAVLFVGLGGLADLSADVVRRAAGAAARNLANAGSVALALPANDADFVWSVTAGFRSGGYNIIKPGSSPKSGLSDVLVLSDCARRRDALMAFEAAQVVEAAADRARGWVNTPPNLLSPATFADEALAYVTQTKALKIRAEILEPDQLAELGCGGILGVGQGSANPPRLLVLRWSHAKPTARIALVGKGVTFDSGGLTIKTGSSMKTMKYDMAGAAAVIAATRAIAELDLAVELIAYAPMAENIPSGTAMRPGDIITMRSGATVEVTNTDAEGRLILADALALAAEADPDLILEVSTLTGACVAALGDRIAGVFGDDRAVEQVLEASSHVGELTWRLPIPERTVEKVRTESKVADLLQADWVRWGSASYAAAFLTQFVGEVPFAHIDIAGPAWNGNSAWGDVPSGGTGYGVRTLVETVRMVAARSAGVPEPDADRASE